MWKSVTGRWSFYWKISTNAHRQWLTSLVQTQKVCSCQVLVWQTLSDINRYTDLTAPHVCINIQVNMPDWMKKKDCCYEKKSKVRRNSLEETILTSLSVAACMWGAHPTLAVVRRAQSRQPATSASLPTNRHARLRLCAVLSVSAAKAGRRGTATAAPSIFPGMRLSAATPLFVFAMLWHLAACCFPLCRHWLISREGLLLCLYFILFYFIF